jgi:hypothetical protein
LKGLLCSGVGLERRSGLPDRSEIQGGAGGWRSRPPDLIEEPTEHRARTLFYALADKAELRLTYPDLEARGGPPKIFAWTPTYRALKEYFTEEGSKVKGPR